MQRGFFLIAMLELVNLKYNSTCFFKCFIYIQFKPIQYLCSVTIHKSKYIVVQPLFDTNIGKIVSPTSENVI